MTIEALAFINDTLNDAGIEYEFGQWSSNSIPSLYFVGEFTDIESLNEDGLQETSFLITGTTHGSWLELIEAKEKIEELFPSGSGKIVMLDNGSSLAIYFGTAIVVPTDTMELKRIQINLTIKEWKVK